MVPDVFTDHRGVKVKNAETQTQEDSKKALYPVRDKRGKRVQNYNDLLALDRLTRVHKRKDVKFGYEHGGLNNTEAIEAEHLFQEEIKPRKSRFDHLVHDPWALNSD